MLLEEMPLFTSNLQYADELPWPKKSTFKKPQELKSELMQTPADAVAGFDFSVFAIWEDNRKEQLN